MPKSNKIYSPGKIALSDGSKPLIAHVIYRLDFGGLENGLVNIINRLSVDKFRHVIICLTDYTEFSERLEQKVELIALHKKPGKDLPLHWRLYKTFRRLKPDVVHTRNLATLEAQLPAWLAGVKYRIHGLHGWDVSDLSGDNKNYQRLYCLMNSLIDRYIPLSQDLEDYLLDKINVSTDKIQRICNGVDTDRFFPAAKPEKHLIPKSNRDKLIIGAVGRLEVVKDQLNLVNAYIELVRTSPELKTKLCLALVGEGSQREAIEGQLKKANLTEYVWFAGARSDVPELLRAMDLFVLPSKAEGISNTLLEAMATGLPVIATSVGGNQQLVEEGKTGKLVPKEDAKALAAALYEYISEPEIMRSHAAAARQRAVLQFSLDKMVADYEKAYKKR